MADLSKHSIRQTVGAFERVILLYPAWDKRKEGYGIHGADAMFAVLRAGAAVEFQLHTGWYLPSCQLPGGLHKPLPGMVLYHAPDPWADYLTEPNTEECRYTGGRCYSDGSGLDANAVFDVLVAEGLAAVWRELEERWVSQFGARYA